jgi:diguanylate cyclase (GGDEF)-like protein/PAS domain S-box-containing protein
LGALGKNGFDRLWTAELFRKLLESAPEGVIVVDATGQIVLVNAETERLFGYGRQELVGQPVELLVPLRSRKQHGCRTTGYLANPHPRSSTTGLELFGLRKDGTEFPAEILLSPFGPDQGDRLTYCAVRDISDRKQAEDNASRLASLVESSDDAIVGETLDGVVMSWNVGAEQLYGYSAEEMLGKSASMLTLLGEDDNLAAVLARVKTGTRVVNLEAVGARKNGKHVRVALTISPVRDSQGQMVGISSIARDMSAVVRDREHLRYLADHDELTGALNRRRFVRDLNEQLERARRYNETAVVMLIDIDHFKQVNDRYGHLVGDRALKMVATALAQRLRRTDTVARIGGDEFGVLLPYDDPEQGAEVAADLRRVVAELRFDPGTGRRLHLEISVGTALLDRYTESDEEVVAAADKDMYQDKFRSRSAAGIVRDLTMSRRVRGTKVRPPARTSPSTA